MRIGYAAVIHGDVEKAGRSKGLHARTDLLQMAAKRLLPLVQAANHLESRVAHAGRRLPGLQGNRVERLVSVAPLICGVKHAPPGQRRKGLDLGDERGPFALR
jgi:hypothetical protein